MGSFFIKFYFFASVAVEEVAEEVSNASFSSIFILAKYFFIWTKKFIFWKRGKIEYNSNMKTGAKRLRGINIRPSEPI